MQSIKAMKKPTKSAKKYTQKQDDAYDKKNGIKENSKKDKALDKKRGLKWHCLMCLWLLAS